LPENLLDDASRTCCTSTEGGHAVDALRRNLGSFLTGFLSTRPH
jgi:hypothetical protein